MADFPKPVELEKRIDPRRWAGEPDLAAIWALAACLIVGAAIFLISAVARI